MLIRQKNLAFAIVSMCCFGTAQANLFVNSGFESGSVDSGGFGNVPSPWIGTFSLADTYDDTGVTANSKMEGFGTPELMNGVTAYEGHRYLGAHTPYGGYNPDGFAQLLATPLTIGNAYSVSAYMLADDRGAFGGIFSNLGAIDVFGLWQGQRTYVGRLAANSVGMTWERRSFTFVAEKSFEYLDFNGCIDSPSAYMGVDAVELVAVPEPATWASIGVAVALLVPRRKRKSA